ncbi:hypothetical protein V6N12_035451 [Hibiscus sabdariffa]|uniref:Uncharacterized protein n=1 Tax=Hibiscus sabdariffa TaxID=183260 RepID=A0ABR2EN27_9ROSI
MHRFSSLFATVKNNSFGMLFSLVHRALTVVGYCTKMSIIHLIEHNDSFEIESEIAHHTVIVEIVKQDVVVASDFVVAAMELVV